MLVMMQLDVEGGLKLRNGAGKHNSAGSGILTLHGQARLCCEGLDLLDIFRRGTELFGEGLA